jgi:hypothetical protein
MAIEVFMKASEIVGQLQISDLFTSLYFWVGIDVLLGGAIVYEVTKFRSEKRNRSNSAPTPPYDVRPIQPWSEIYDFSRDFERQVTKLGIPTAISKGFQISLKTMIEKYGIKNSPDLTDVELIKRFEGTAPLETVNTLRKMYSIYEPVRFGENKEISPSDLASFREKLLFLSDKAKD